MHTAEELKKFKRRTWEVARTALTKQTLPFPSLIIFHFTTSFFSALGSLSYPPPSSQPCAEWQLHKLSAQPCYRAAEISTVTQSMSEFRKKCIKSFLNNRVFTIYCIHIFLFLKKGHLHWLLTGCCHCLGLWKCCHIAYSLLVTLHI